jgi:hypothetical protein
MRPFTVIHHGVNGKGSEACRPRTPTVTDHVIERNGAPSTNRRSTFSVSREMLLS